MKKRYTQLKLRIPLTNRLDQNLHRLLVAAAKKNGRSLNSEIIHRLSQPFEKEMMEKIIKKTVREYVKAAAEAERS